MSALSMATQNTIMHYPLCRIAPTPHFMPGAHFIGAAPIPVTTIISMDGAFRPTRPIISAGSNAIMGWTFAGQLYRRPMGYFQNTSGTADRLGIGCPPVRLRNWNPSPAISSMAALHSAQGSMGCSLSITEANGAFWDWKPRSTANSGTISRFEVSCLIRWLPWW